MRRATSSAEMPAQADEKPGGLLTSPARLRKIDLLRDKNIGKYLPLPQLVAVGDQSSGKSSLLESLTGIPFPRGQQLCTRYATQITHRRESQAFINVSIIPGPGASASEKESLAGYHRSVSTTSELHDQLPSILDEVNKLMGIRTPQNPEGTKTFTEDVLKVEKCGPNEDYLTVIDVPGIFRITTDNVTTEADKIMVRSMVENYIRDDQTIILAVLPCNVDIVTQEILALAEKYDPTGRRTLGILTKPDLVLERSAQSVVCSLVRGEKKPLNLGYHLVRSRGGDDDEGTLFGDNERDILFKEEPWRDLSTDRLGVMLDKAKKDLAHLGLSRQTVQEQQQFLVAIASEFQALVRSALSADYSSHAFFDDDQFRLITRVLNATEEFKAEFNLSAHTYEFIQPAGSVSGADSSPPEAALSEPDSSISRANVADEEMPPGRFPDLNSVIVRERNDDEPRQGIMAWIKEIHHRSRGTELFSFNPAVFSTAFRQQTSKCMTQAEVFVSRIIFMIHNFIVSTLKVVCSDEKVRDEILAQILDAALTRYESGLSQVRFLVKVETEGHPYTLNDFLRTKFTNLQGARMECELSNKIQSVKLGQYFEIGDEEEFDAITVEGVQCMLREKDGGKYVAEDVHNLLQSYYEVARDRFIDNVYRQSVTHSLVSGENSPLKLFSEKWVLGLEPDRLDAIAGESLQTREQRAKLVQRIKDLTDAVSILR
ncbi:interferon-induced GTP-binding protein Mx2 [Cordyceps javanica]|uniref:Interferon-induced GTP-binding protein Mx2 n=1 Tax=Cordyceps javanica TaxID=43265 RepID=A0A545V0N1_9HYPO|nr:interferon-induced GTP-binding protein Mx2 [Cordyceps javanica]TQW05522.1 interferon-induced GTP-binding protein Mx2 [Cordyceps javanica]